MASRVAFGLHQPAPGGAARPMTDQYFSPTPGAAHRPRQVTLALPDLTATLATDAGVFSPDRVDAGTRLLLLEAPPMDDATTVLDLGCGYGALLDTLRGQGRAVQYRGYDISADMVAAASQRHAADPASAFSTDLAPFRPSDVVVASGVFNVRLGHPVDEWHDYVWDTIETMHEVSTRGFAFNMLSTYSDPERRRDALYYADPCAVFDRCKRAFSPRVALLHDYPLFEFTIIVRK